MAKGSTIVRAANPRGIFLEGTIRTAEKPGTFVQVDVSEGVDTNENMQWEPYAPGTDGEQRLVAILREDVGQGKLATEAYAAGDHCFLYVPYPGEELNALVADVAGTADDHSFGDIMIIDSGTGKLIATTGTPESEPIMLMEAITDPTADTLARCLFTGY